jgi:hypothetical protein
MKAFIENHQNWWINKHAFGKASIAESTVQIKAKLENEGFSAIYLGSPRDHNWCTYIS